MPMAAMAYSPLGSATTDEALQALAWKLRIDALEAIYRAGSGHVGGSFSCAELLTVLYFGILQMTPEKLHAPDRDRVILSKGHGVPMLYAILAEIGAIPREELWTLRQLGSRLQGHPEVGEVPGIEAVAGPLGLGLSTGLGMAVAADHLGLDSTVWVISSDGDLQEGIAWEAMMAAQKFRPRGLVLVADLNRVQLDGPTAEVMPMGDVARKIAAFGWPVQEIDGHDVAQIDAALRWARAYPGPAAVVAHTVKGKGVSFMEGQAAWHGRPVDAESYRRAVAELQVALARLPGQPAAHAGERQVTPR